MNKIYIKSLAISTLVVVIYTIAIIFFVSPKIEDKITSLESQIAHSKLQQMLTIVQSSADELESFKKTSIEIHKQELKSIVEIAQKKIESLYEESQPKLIGNMVTNETKKFILYLQKRYKTLRKTFDKQTSIDILAQVVHEYRFDGDNGSFVLKPIDTDHDKKPLFPWSIVPKYDYKQKIQDNIYKAIDYIESLRYGEDEYLYLLSYESQIIAHPKLRGKDFSKVKDKKGNLIVPPQVKIAREQGEGYYSYWWTRLSDKTTLYEKLSFAKDFKPWQWIIGTGLYLVDIDKEEKKKKQELIETLRQKIYQTTISKDGVIFIADAQGKILIHKEKQKENTNLNTISSTLFDKIKTTQKQINYQHKGVDKTLWVAYHKEFDWYICADVKTKNIIETSLQMKNYIYIIATALFILAFIISLYLFKKLLKPIEILSQKSLEVTNGNLNVRSNITSSDEVGILASTFDGMLDTIEEHIDSLDLLVAQKTAKISTLLDNAGQGFLSFDEQGIIDDEYSKECEVIFQTKIEGANITDLLYANGQDDQKKLFIKIIQDILDPNIASKKRRVFINLAPKEFVINEKNILIAYKVLGEQKVMLILSDITAQKALEAKIEQEKKRLKMVVSVVSNTVEFQEMLQDWKHFCDDLDTYLHASSLTLGNITQIYRDIHTFKGNFAQKDLIFVVPKLHALESSLNLILKNPNRTIDDLRTLFEDITPYDMIDEDMQILTKVLGEDFLQNSKTIGIDEPTIKQLEFKIDQILKYNKHERETTYEDLLSDIKHLQDSNLAELLSSYPKMVAQLAKRLGKGLHPMQIIGDLSIKVPPAIKPFIKTLVHIFRNSIDHGIESIDERLSLGKDEMASITCLLNSDQKSISISIIDDGKGIDPRIIAQKALQKGLLTKEQLQAMNAKEIMRLIFADTMSTKESVSDLSGRGIGLAAVITELDKLGGYVEIDTKINKGTTFKFTIDKNFLMIL
jgi:two-component system chemotaxis sensor kinase CheA